MSKSKFGLTPVPCTAPGEPSSALPVPETEVLVIGGGLVGLSIARELAMRNLDVLLLERHGHLGEETSSHNSQVIHSGIYYPTGSLKARLCVRGRASLYELAERRGIPHRRAGKLVVAQSPEEASLLETLRRQGLQNGVPDLEIWDRATVALREPAVRCYAALFVPVTGIIDASVLLSVLREDLVAYGGLVALQTTALGLWPDSGSWRVRVQGASGETSDLRSRLVINAAGLSALKLARLSGLDVDRLGYRLYPARGHYLRIRHLGKVGTTRLIYPVPAPHLEGLGIHLTWTVGGEALLGPDVEWLTDLSDPPAYQVDESRLPQFARAASRYLPGLQEEDLVPDTAGIRPKLSGPGDPFRDFVLETDPQRPGILHLLGIESPGLTACLALAEEAADRLLTRGP